MKIEEAREKTMQLVFQMAANNDFNYENLSIISEDRNVLKSGQALRVLKAIKEHISDIDETISSHMDKWKIDRIGKADLAILRVAVAEILYVEEVPQAVSINEAVELSKKYGDAKSSSFVNAVLGKICNEN
ncbi:MAG: transcription antitermination factor NusB [Baileyella intestinalis]|uniref:transcription antitermination factor NusB n=1 Tax=Baileyella intestinalis TaxID=2606709 RepID=UPI002A7531DB|nr:transcription antitermination factor NusB [Baileyella intestinalis]MCI7686298.1 transcription antitermination factor NusB [Clostridiales bacterium]MDY2995521.1 transcription antitermination factor NusB [Baileyella intestinalis]